MGLLTSGPKPSIFYHTRNAQDGGTFRTSMPADARARLVGYDSYGARAAARHRQFGIARCAVVRSQRAYLHPIGTCDIMVRFGHGLALRVMLRG